MREREHELLEGLERMEADAARIGLCPAPFRLVREELMRIIGERDGMADAAQKALALVEDLRRDDALCWSDYSRMFDLLTGITSAGENLE